MPARIPQTQFVAKQDALLAGIDTRQISAADKVRALDSALARYSLDKPQVLVAEWFGTADKYYLLSGIVSVFNDADATTSIDVTSAGAVNQIGVSFTLPRTMTISAVRWLVARTGSPAGTFACQIRLDSGGVPAALGVGASDAVTVATSLPLTIAAGKTEFTFSLPVTLTAGTYHAVLVPSGYTYSAGVTAVGVGVEQGADVVNTVSVYSGSAWTAYGTASAGGVEVIASLPGYEARWSDIKGADIPAPAILQNMMPIPIEDEDFRIYRYGESEYLYLPNHAPDYLYGIRLSYSGRYAFNGVPLGVDIPIAHFEAVCALSAYFACTWLAARYGQNIDSGLNADISDRRNQSDVYQSRAKEFMQQYQGLLNMGDDAAVVPASKLMDMDRSSYSNRDFIHHNRRRR